MFGFCPVSCAYVDFEPVQPCCCLVDACGLCAVVVATIVMCNYEFVSGVVMHPRHSEYQHQFWLVAVANCC